MDYSLTDIRVHAHSEGHKVVATKIEFLMNFFDHGASTGPVAMKLELDDEIWLMEGTTVKNIVPAGSRGRISKLEMPQHVGARFITADFDGCKVALALLPIDFILGRRKYPEVEYRKGAESGAGYISF